MKRSLLIAAAVGSLLAASASFAQAPPAGGAPPNRPSPDQQATNYRQALMTVVAGQAGPLIAVARGRAPYDLAAVRKGADRLEVLAKMIPDAFDRDTSAATTVKSAALPVVWKDHADFLAKAKDTADKVDALETAAKAGVEADVKKALGDVGATCGACHDKYRQADQ